MSNMQINPYIFFQGKAAEAMDFYKAIFGGELTTQKYSEVPGMDSGDMADMLIHADLSGGLIRLMASDSSKPDPEGRVKISLSLNGDDEPRMRGIFDQLAEGGNIQDPLTKQFWGDLFGVVQDKYGVDWMFNITLPKIESA